MNASGRVAALAVSVIIPVFRGVIGGWTATVVVLSIIGAAHWVDGKREGGADRKAGEYQF